MKKNFVLTSLCVSLFSTSMFAVSLRDSVETALNNNPNIIAEKKIKKHLENMSMIERDFIFQL